MNNQIHDKEQTMAHQADNSVIETVVQLLCENGLSHMADAMRLMLNEAMRIERSQALEAGPYQRTERRRGYANGFKPKTVSTRLGELALEDPGQSPWKIRDSHRNSRIHLIAPRTQTADGPTHDTSGFGFGPGFCLRKLNPACCSHCSMN
jgi:hypothetical protein